MARVRFAFITDTHFVVSSNGKDSLLWNRQLLTRSEAIGDALVRAIDRVAPDFVVHGGDLTHDGDRTSLEYGVTVLKRFGRPVLYVPGNHDTREPGAREFIGQLLGDGNAARFRSEMRCGIRFILLDSNFALDEVGHGDEVMDWRTPEKYRGIGFSDAEIEWFSNQVDTPVSEPTVIITHHPIDALRELPRLLPRESADPSLRLAPVPALGYWPDGRLRMIEALRRARAGTIVFSGHWHLNQIFFDGMHHHVVSASLTEYPFEFRVIDVEGDSFHVTTESLGLDAFRSDSIVREWSNTWVTGGAFDRDRMIRIERRNA